MGFGDVVQHRGGHTDGSYLHVADFYWSGSPHWTILATGSSEKLIYALAKRTSPSSALAGTSQVPLR